MSVVNRVLKDLDRKGAAPASLLGVQAVQTSLGSARPRWPWLLLLGVGVAATAWFWPDTTQEAVAPEIQEGAPSLRLSESLSSPALPTPPAEAATVAAEKAQPMSAEPTRPVPPHAAQAVVDGPAVLPEADKPPPVKLDTRLPDPRPAKVIKEVRPLTPREQADLAWRQAERLIEQGRGPSALEGLEAALRLDPSHGPARQTLIALSLEGGNMAHDMARGETLLRDGLQLHPNDAWYSRSLGQLYLQRGEVSQSAAILKAGLGKGADAGYWGLYAGVLGKAGRHEEAVQAYREATRLNPGHGPWWIGLAVSLEQRGQRQEASVAYQRALQVRLAPEVREFAARKVGELVP